MIRCSGRSHGDKSKFYVALSYFAMFSLSGVEVNFACFSPHHFKRVKISATALIKIVMHARRGGDIEVMGLMQGKVKGGKHLYKDIFLIFWYYRHLLRNGLLRSPCRGN